VSSDATADILLPGIELCRNCHGSQQTRGSARSDCVECHAYHHDEGKQIDGPLSLDLSLSSPQKVRRPPSLTDKGSLIGDRP
jgi:hypothetical protein